MFDLLRKNHFVQAVGVIVVGVVCLFLFTRGVTFLFNIAHSFLDWFTGSFVHILMGAVSAFALLFLVYSAVRHSGHD